MNYKRMQGLTLIETMVAITISLILLAGAITLFVNNKVAYETNDNLSRLQENARFAIDFMLEDLRMAGYFGCRNTETPNNGIVAVAGDGSLEDSLSPLEGFDDDDTTQWYPSGNADTIGNILDGTDAVTIRRFSGPSIFVTSDGDAGSLTLADDEFGDGSPAIAANDVLAVSDCGGANIFQTTTAGTTVSSVDIPAGYDANPADPADPANPIVTRYVAVRYFVGQDANQKPALFREVLDPTDIANPIQQQLIEGVESMQIVYGVDNDNDNVPDTYVPAGNAALDDVNEWSNVVAVRLSLLMRTTRPYGDADDVGNITYQLNDDTFTVPNDVVGIPVADPNPNDTARRYKRRVFNTTVLLRNRLT